MRLPLSSMLCCTLVLSMSSLAAGQEEMTVARFKQIEAKQGDDKPLIQQLARIPIWKKAVINISTKYQDGKSFKEECSAATKTVEGRYIVYTVESQYYGQPMSSILEFDEKRNPTSSGGCSVTLLLIRRSSTTSRNVFSHPRRAISQESSKSRLRHFLIKRSHAHPRLQRRSAVPDEGFQDTTYQTLAVTITPVSVLPYLAHTTGCRQSASRGQALFPVFDKMSGL